MVLDEAATLPAFAARFSWRVFPTFLVFLFDFWDLSAMVGSCRFAQLRRLVSRIGKTQPSRRQRSSLAQ